MNNENFQGSPKGRTWTPRYDNYGGFKDKLGVFMENEKNLNSVLKDVLNVSIDYLNVVFTSDQIWDGNEVASPRFAFLDFLGLDLVDGSFSEGKGIYGYNESVRSDGVIVAWKADNSSILYSFSGIGCARLGLSDKDFLVKVMEYIGKKGGWISRIDIALDVANNTIFPLSKMIEKLENQEFTSKKRRFNRFDERDASGNLLGSTVYFGKSRADVGSKGNVYLRAYRKDLELISKGEQLPAWSNGCDTIERFELSFNGRSKTEIVRREIIDRKGELLALHLGLLADVVTFRVPPQGKDKKKSRWEVDQSWVNFTNQQKATQYEQKEEFGLDDIKSMLNWVHHSVAPSLSLLAKISEEKDIDFWKILQNEANFRELSYKQEYLKSHKSVEKLESEKLEDMLNGFLSGKRSYASKPGELKKVDMEQRAKELEAKKSKREKAEEKRREKAKENRKIATERVNKRVEKAETRLKKKADKEWQKLERAKQRLEKQKQGLELEREKMRKAIIRELKKEAKEKGVEKV